MPQRKKKKSTAAPKARGIWRINPKTRVKKSEKTYSRAKERKQTRINSDQLDWFGDRGGRG